LIDLDQMFVLKLLRSSSALSWMKFVKVTFQVLSGEYKDDLSGILHHVAWQTLTDISDMLTASIIMALP
jgi:hypothetical protein